MTRFNSLTETEQQAQAKILFSCTLDHEVRPKVRMTGPSKWNKRSQDYLKHQGELRGLFVKQKTVPTITTLCSLRFNLEIPHRRGVDLDNLLKAIGDALQENKKRGDEGVIVDDRLIRHFEGRFTQKKKGPARLVLELRSFTCDKCGKTIETIEGCINCEEG